MQGLAIWLIHFYQKHWSHRTGTCFHYPSCSQYGIDAITKYGVRQGIILTAERIQRCTTEEREKFHANHACTGCSARRYDVC